MFLGCRARLVRGADNLTAIYEPIVYTPIFWGIISYSWLQVNLRFKGICRLHVQGCKESE
jgi:hypothetical protein